MPKRAAEPSRRAANVRAQEITEPCMLYGTGATEPGDPDNLAELNDKSAGIGTWVLKVYGMRHQTYEKQKGEKLECLLLAADGNYCQGVIKTIPRKAGGANPGVQLREMMRILFGWSPWGMAKLTRSKEAKEYIGPHFKVCVDMRKPQPSSLMQGANPGGHPCVPPAPVLEDDLQCI